MIHPHSGGVSNLPPVEELTEKILYWLSSDQRVRALAEKLLHRFEETVGDLPASEKHHHCEPGGLYRHSLEVALKALEEFEGDIIMESRSDGSIDSFRSSRNRPRWQYATFIGALCHDLGKVFDLEVRGKGETWSPIHDRYCEFCPRIETSVASWDPDRAHGEHAARSERLLHRVVSLKRTVEYLATKEPLKRCNSHNPFPTQPFQLGPAGSIVNLGESVEPLCTRAERVSSARHGISWRVCSCVDGRLPSSVSNHFAGSLGVPIVCAQPKSQR